MRRIYICVLVLLAVLNFQIAYAKGDLTKQEPVEISVGLGDKAGKPVFVPDALRFETGKLYKLILVNNSPDKHYFSSDGFSRAVHTRKVQVRDAAGKSVAEIKGTIREIEVYPGQRAEWWFVPVAAGRFDDLKCTIKGHAEAGMIGKIVIE